MDVRSDFREWLSHSWTGPEVAGETWKDRLRYKLSFERMLDEAGWLTLDWPVEDGGHGLTLADQGMVFEECARAGAPEIGNVAGRIMVAPLLRLFGTDEQRSRYLPGIRSCADLWCQGFSEPDAGSDLYSLRTTIRTDGSGFRLSGEKTWVTYAPIARYSFVLTRDARAVEAGERVPLSIALVDLEAEGVEVRPIEKLTGEDDFGSIFFDDVRLEADGIVGAAGQGRDIVFALLGFERSVVWLSRYLRMASRAAGLAKEVAGTSLARDAESLVARSAALVGMAMHLLRDPLVGQRSSVVKIYGSRLDSALAELGAKIWSPAYSENHELGVSAEEQRDWVRTISTSVAAGVDEVQLETVAKLLGVGRGVAAQ